jgi:Protein of unknown function (DUF2971)
VVAHALSSESMITLSKLPKLVVRFYGNLDFALDAISSRQIALIHVSKINDPFDPYFYFETDFNEDYDRLMAYVRDRHVADLDLFKRLRPEENWSQNMAAIKAYFQELRDSTYPFSTVADEDGKHPVNNLYMWGHYANGHRGVAIEFDPVEIGKTVLTEYNQVQSEELQLHDIWAKVKYVSDVSPVTAEMYFDFAKKFIDDAWGKSKLHEYYEAISNVKSEIWKNEREWRLHVQRHDTRARVLKYSIGAAAIKGVYLGLKAPTSSTADFKSKCKVGAPPRNCLKPNKAVGQIALEFHEVIE